MDYVIIDIKHILSRAVKHWLLAVVGQISARCFNMLTTVVASSKDDQYVRDLKNQAN